MSNKNDKIDEISSENESESELKDKLIKLDDKNPFNYDINMNGSKLLKGEGKTNPRLSCQPVLSFLKRHDSNFSIRQSKTRKKTTEEYFKGKTKSILLTPLTQLKSNSIVNIINKNEEKNNKKSNQDLNYKTKLQIKGEFKILGGKLNIYERAKKGILRKNNYIKKKQEQQLKEINNNLIGPKISKNSQEIIERKANYIPIEYRASELHSKHIFESILNEKKVLNKKLKEENKEREIIKQYSNKKSFNENDWEDFLNNQEYWFREKKYKIKAAELFRNDIEEKNFIPEIDIKSKKIMESIRKNNFNIDDAHTRLYKEFYNLQERKKIRVCNSMPTFTPLINKDLNKSIFQKKPKIYNSTRKFDQILDSLLEKKLNRHKKKRDNGTKLLSKSFINNNLTSRETHSNYIFNSNNMIKSNNNLNNNRYDENSISILNNYKKYRNQNFDKNYIFNKNKIRQNNKIENFKMNSINIDNNKNKRSNYINGNNSKSCKYINKFN